jgi:hypothetical protein
MKKFTAIMLSAVFMLSMLFFAGCESETENEIGVIGVEILSTSPQDSVSFGGTIDVSVKLTGFTFEYHQINYYFGDNEVPSAVYSKDQLNILAASQEKSAEFVYTVSTDGLESGLTELRVEAVSNDLRKISSSIPMLVTKPTENETNLDLQITSPLNDSEYRIGDNIQVSISIEGNTTMFESLSAYLNSSTEPIYYTETGSPTIQFSFATVDFPVGPLSVELVLKTKDGLEKTRTIILNLIEYIPTFTVQGETGYELKSLIQTFDKGYLSVSSRSTTGSPAPGTRVTKFNEEGQQLWSIFIDASVGIGLSVCEDNDYDKGYVIAGWRQNGSHKDTWVRKINQTNGALIWNKTYGYTTVHPYFDTENDGVEYIDDGASVIKKSIDDGYIIGGYTKNIYGTDYVSVTYGSEPVRTLTFNWETGYDVRLLKIYSNGNEVWGHNVDYVSHKMWHDIVLHKLDGILWTTTMGDQMISDLIVKENGNYLLTGWNNQRLYFGESTTPDTSKRDMFFAEVDFFGGYVNTMTWSRMGGTDEASLATDKDPYSNVLNITLIGANHLGDYTETEIGYGLVESQGGYDGDVVIAGETYQRDSKAKLNDSWVVEFKINGDEDGALWENAFGDVGKDDKTYSIDRTRDGGYILTGYNTGADRNTWLFKLDTMLRTVWSVGYGVAGDDFGAKVIQTTDGGYIIGGNTGTELEIRSKLIKVNKTGVQSK